MKRASLHKVTKKHVGRVVGKIKKRAYVTFWRAKRLGISINNEIIKRRKIVVMQGKKMGDFILATNFQEQIAEKLLFELPHMLFTQCCVVQSHVHQNIS